MKKVLIIMMLLAQSAGVHAQVNLEDRQTANTPPPIADDQPALKGQRQTPNSPTIRITRSETLPQTQNNRIYDVDFVIQSNENIPGIASTASYKIARCLNGNCTTRDTTTTYIPSNITATSLQFARISAEITLNNLEDIRATWGFVLLRASASALRDADGNPPVNTNGETIEANEILGVGEGAIAKRDRTRPQITLSFRQISYRGKRRSALSGKKTNDDIYDLIFWVITDKTIPTLGNINYFRLIRVSDSDPEGTVHSRLTQFRTEFLEQNLVQFTIGVIMQPAKLGSTKGFTLARVDPLADDPLADDPLADDSLLDIWGNPPVRAEDSMPIGTGTGGLLSTTLISPSWALNIQARIRAKVLLEGPLR